MVKKKLFTPKPSSNLLPSEADEWTKEGGIDPENQSTSSPPPVAEPKKGRAKGKRSDPNYTQIGAYIPVDLHKRVKRRLVDEDIDLSDLITQLLDEWVSD